MTAVRIDKIEDALLARYAGISLTVGGTPTSVSVFVEDPAVEEYEERVYPSISVKLLSIMEDNPARDSEDEEKEIIATSSAPVPVTTNRQRGEPYRLQYSLDTWHRVRAAEERDLLHSAFIERTPTRGSISVEDIDGNTETLWVFWAGNIVALDEPNIDEIIYHKSLTVDVLATLLSDTVTEAIPTVTEQRWRVQRTNFVTDVSLTDTTIRVRESVDDEAL